MQIENVKKSIIYGSPYKNRYGTFLPICSSITDRAAIESILDYMKETPHFKKYNRIAYAYRVQQTPVVFITEKKNVQTQFYEGCHSDQTIQGSGQKLLHLLEKFNVRNVVIAIMIQQYNPLFPFQCTNYRAIVQNCRLLLDELYRKVVQIQDHAEVRSFNDLLLHNTQTAKLKKTNIEQVQLPQQKKPILKDRPNHIYNQSSKAQSLVKKSTQPPSSSTQQVKFLWQRCTQMKDQFQSLVQSLETKQLQQLRYYSMYDKDPVINQVVKMFLIHENVDKNILLNDYDFDRIKNMKFEILEEKISKKLEDFFKVNKKISVDVVMKCSRPIGILFAMIDIKLRFSKMLKRIGEIMEKNNQTQTIKQIFNNDTQQKKPSTQFESVGEKTNINIKLPKKSK